MEEQEEEGGYLIWGVFCALSVLFLIWTGIRHYYYLDQGTSTTCATVYKIVSSDAAGNKMLLFRYEVEGKEYKGSLTASYFELCPSDNACIGKTFKLTYAVKNPEVIESSFKDSCDE